MAAAATFGLGRLIELRTRIGRHSMSPCCRERSAKLEFGKDSRAREESLSRVTLIHGCTLEQNENSLDVEGARLLAPALEKLSGLRTLKLVRGADAGTR